MSVSPTAVPPSGSGLAWAALLCRGIVGLQFLMAGWFKVFEMGAPAHARRLFVEGYAESWIPSFLLWGVGFTIPFVELLAGALVLVGFRTRWALVALTGVLLIVTYGHLLKEPLYDITTHIFPRAIFVLAACLIPRSADRFSIDGLLRNRA